MGEGRKDALKDGLERRAKLVSHETRVTGDVDAGAYPALHEALGSRIMTESALCEKRISEGTQYSIVA